MNSDLDGWRFATELFVEDIAILLSGGNPSDTEPQQVGHSEYELMKRTNSHPGYDGYLMMLQSAIRRSELTATIRHPAYVGPGYGSAPHRNLVLVIAGEISSRLLADDSMWPGEDFADEWIDKLVVERAPDWTRTSVEVSALKAWLRSIGFNRGFFFESVAIVAEDFEDRSNEFFSPELSLAVKAWRAVSSQKIRGQSPKSAIERWIDQNPRAWEGDGKPSESAKERIATLVNWQKSGGAPKTN